MALAAGHVQVIGKRIPPVILSLDRCSTALKPEPASWYEKPTVITSLRGLTDRSTQSTVVIWGTGSTLIQNTPFFLKIENPESGGSERISGDFKEETSRHFFSQACSGEEDIFIFEKDTF